MRPQIFDVQTDVNSSGRCSYFTVYNGRMVATPVLFPRLRLIQGYQVRFITLLKTVTPHSSLLVAASAGFDHSRKVDSTPGRLYEEILEVDGHPSKE